MKKLVILTIVILVITLLMFAQADTADEAEKAAIIQCAMDYLDGGHAGSGERMARAIHPEVHKVRPAPLPKSGRTGLMKGGASRLTALIQAGAVAVPKDQRNIDMKILDSFKGLAIVRARSSRFYEHLQMARIDGEWKIINVLWIPRPKDKGEPAQKESEPVDQGIRQAALDYIEGAFSGDAERMERGIHSELHKVRPVKEQKTGKTMLDKMGASLLIEATRADLLHLDEGKRNIEVTILDHKAGIAAVRVVSALYIDYLELARFNGQWKIVNVLWILNPSTSAKN